MQEITHKYLLGRKFILNFEYRKILSTFAGSFRSHNRKTLVKHRPPAGFLPSGVFFSYGTEKVCMVKVPNREP